MWNLFSESLLTNLDCKSRAKKQPGCCRRPLKRMMTNTHTSQMQYARRASVWLFVTLLAFVASAQEPNDSADRPARSSSASESELPYNQQPINYSQASPTDPVAKLQKQLESGEIKLQRDGESGVLKDLLRALKVPVSSQLLVFSKSSANARFIKPQTPRAIYFNDLVYVGWVPGSPAIELSAVDSTLGGTFYSLQQSEVAAPVIRRDESCLLCHLTRSTLRVPGHLVRSFTTDALGELRTGWSRITHDSPYEKRWAGWYVTGGTSELNHLGNLFGTQPPASDALPKTATVELSPTCQKTRYLFPQSDILPHLVLDHQAHGHNLITRLSYEVCLQKPITALEPLVSYLLFLDEPPLPGPITTNAEYRTWFEQQGPRDPQGRSLRQFDLQTRLFKYRLSYLIYSDAFEGLHESTRREIYERIKGCLIATNEQHPRGSIPLEERQAIMAILRATKTGLPEGW